MGESELGMGMGTVSVSRIPSLESIYIHNYLLLPFQSQSMSGFQYVELEAIRAQSVQSVEHK